MKHYVGLDVSLESTSICVVDENGSVVFEGTSASDPEAIADVVLARRLHLTRVGLEAGPLSQWLAPGLAGRGLPAMCIETRRMKAFTAAMINKTDRNDARAIAQAMRTGLFRPVHVKTRPAQEARLLLTNRRLLLGKLRDIENEVRGTLRNFGLKMGQVGSARFAARVDELLAEEPRLAALVAPMLVARRCLAEQVAHYDRLLLAAARASHDCRRLMTVPGVGPVTALAFMATIDVPSRFARSKTVGAILGLTPKRWQSGATDRDLGISKCGDGLLRSLLFEAATVLMTLVKRPCALKRWAGRVARRRGVKRARVALARKLAVLLHHIWVSGQEFDWGDPAPAAAAA